MSYLVLVEVSEVLFKEVSNRFSILLNCSHTSFSHLYSHRSILVGEGGSKIIKGAGKGVGQVVGGVSGGIMLTVKGLGKGVVEGDGQAVLTGLGDGAVSIGNGLLKGGESVVTGVGDGVLAVGQGLFKGVKNIGMGLGGAVTGKPPKPKEKDSASQSTKNKNVNRRRHH